MRHLTTGIRFPGQGAIIVRCLATALAVTLAMAPAFAQNPRADVHFSESPLRIDGNLNDAAWKTATPLPLVAMSGQADDNGPVARMAWDRNYLYVGVELPDTILVADRSGRDSPIWEKDDVLSVFLWPREDQPYYYQIAVNPRGTFYDAFFIANATRTGAVFSLPDWNPEVKAQARLHPATVYRSNSPGKPVEGGHWTLEMGIPIAALGSRTSGLPAPGERWRVQIVRFNRPDPSPGELDAAAWSPYGEVTEPFRLDYFGTIVFQGGPAPVIPPLVPRIGVSEPPPPVAPVAPAPPVAPEPPVVTAPVAPVAPEPPAVTPPVTPEPPPTVTPPSPPEPPVTPEPPVVTAPVTPEPPVVTPPVTPAPPPPVSRTTISVSFTNVPFREAMDTLFRGSDLIFTVAPAVAQRAPTVTAEVRDLEFDEALAAILDAAGRQHATTIRYVKNAQGEYRIDLAAGSPATPPSVPPGSIQ